MTEIKLSPRADALIEWVRQETEKPVNINFVDNIGINMPARFTITPDQIRIDIVMGKQQSNDDVDHSACHEAIHGYLIHKRGYYFPEPIVKLTPEDARLLSLVGTTIDDIVVNKILEDSGIKPISPTYIRMVKKEIKAMNEGKDIYREFLEVGRIFHEKFKVFRYVMAWGTLNYYTLLLDDRKVLSRFMKHFKRYYSTHVNEADGIIHHIIEHDIFTREGHRSTFGYVCDLWRLGEKIRLSTYI